MNANDRDRLLLEYLDDTITPSDRAVVEAALAADATWRARHGELASVFQRLARLEPADPPADLRDRVIAEIRSRQAAIASPARTARASSAFGGLSLLGHRPRLVIGFTFAAGLAIGALAMLPARHALTPLTTGDPGMLGAMGGAPDTNAPVIVQLPDARMTGYAEPVGEASRITLVISIPEGTMASLEDPDASRSPTAVRRQSGASGSVQVEDHRVNWTGPVRGRYEIDFSPPHPGAASLEMSLVSSNGSARAPLPPEAGPQR